mmetsp:Transcript_8006/g.12448  ORF Transcript_8006/g.12448 Transcript_8006/m.12448 type:complete len:228 (-) Transcript_8006:4806-5489(-)
MARKFASTRPSGAFPLPSCLEAASFAFPSFPSLGFLEDSSRRSLSMLPRDSSLKMLELLKIRPSVSLASDLCFSISARPSLSFFECSEKAFCTSLTFTLEVTRLSIAAMSLPESYCTPCSRYEGERDRLRFFIPPAASINFAYFSGRMVPHIRHALNSILFIKPSFEHRHVFGRASAFESLPSSSFLASSFNLSCCVNASLLGRHFELSPSNRSTSLRISRMVKKLR